MLVVVELPAFETNKFGVVIFGLFLSPCFNGKQTGQSLRTQFLQWLIICLEELQCGVVHALPAWHEDIWDSTCFIVLQCGKLHCTDSPLFTFWIRFWHLWACNNNTNCCWISFRFSGSAIKKFSKILKKNLFFEKKHFVINNNIYKPVGGAGCDCCVVACCGPLWLLIGAPDWGCAGDGAGGCVTPLSAPPPTTLFCETTPQFLTTAPEVTLFINIVCPTLFWVAVPPLIIRFASKFIFTDWFRCCDAINKE